MDNDIRNNQDREQISFHPTTSPQILVNPVNLQQSPELQIAEIGEPQISIYLSPLHVDLFKNKDLKQRTKEHF